MKDIEQYGLLKDDEWEYLPWIPNPRPPFKIWVQPEDIAPFFFIQHHPYALSLLLKIDDGFKADTFNQIELEGNSKDWEALTKGLIKEYEENNSGMGLFHFDSDEGIFCVFSQYVDDLMMLATIIRATCDDDKLMRNYLGFKENKDFTYRKATLEDVTLLVDTKMKCSLEQGNKWDEIMVKEINEMYTEQFTRLLRENTLVFYLAFDGDIIAGMGGLYVWNGNTIQGTSTLTHLYTMPEYRHKGIAHQIISLLIQIAIARNCKSIETHLSTEPCMEEKQRSFLKRFGFQDIYDDEDTCELGDVMEMQL